jgi:uncharacterized FlaG/YvyC family protein
MISINLFKAQKLCCTCKTNKYLYEFGNSKDTKDRLRIRCRVCESIKWENYSIKEPASLSHKKEGEFTTNRELLAEKARKRYLENREERLLYNKEYVEKTKKNLQHERKPIETLIKLRYPSTIERLTVKT